MVKKIRFVALSLLPLCLLGCSLFGHKGPGSQSPPPAVAEVANSPIRIKVADVSNDTRQVFDVDAIGMLWDGVDKALAKRGMLWVPKSEGQPYVMDCHIVYFKESSLGKRVLPHFGDTILKVRVEISRDGRHVATINVSRTLGYGKGMWTLRAWKVVFADVSEDIVKQATAKL